MKIKMRMTVPPNPGLTFYRDKNGLERTVSHYGKNNMFLEYYEQAIKKTR